MARPRWGLSEMRRLNTSEQPMEAATSAPMGLYWSTGPSRAWGEFPTLHSQPLELIVVDRWCGKGRRDNERIASNSDPSGTDASTKMGAPMEAFAARAFASPTPSAAGPGNEMVTLRQILATRRVAYERHAFPFEVRTKESPVTTTLLSRKRWASEASLARALAAATGLLYALSVAPISTPS